jgi:hypothetical protein
MIRKVALSIQGVDAGIETSANKARSIAGLRPYQKSIGNIRFGADSAL